MLALTTGCAAVPRDPVTATAVAESSTVAGSQAPVASAPEGATPDSTATPFPSVRVRGWQTGLVRGDRLQHFSLSLTLAAGGGVATRTPAVGGGGAFLLGLAKEWRDRRTTDFDPADLLADALGAAAGAFLSDALVRGPQR